ncbi:acetylornithine deacetylase [Aspergillus steynii IBT 23096]|uniref:Acetylornithine deacetylase n=1 Tax=Aspergillus steynii IBT 23096 TaxID=1392250 RepID=A0A2I2GAE5_9EURO|nr:acetylornithine deacetylase [Aspergillus steynii IBT 23096]PLB49850.1 acetylornithine deacetylase [Aspergillus steynii IBT 23096]
MPKISSELAASIAESVARGFDDQIAYTQRLIRVGGQRGLEFEVQGLVYDEFWQRGYNPVKLDMNEDLISQHEGAGRFSAEHSKTPVVVGVHQPKVQATDGKSLILNAHIDIVPTGPVDLWTRDPYSGAIDGDKLYGRGGADMRAGSAANLFALDALRRLGLQPASKVVLESVVEEESTGNGTLLTHLSGYRADAVIIPEPMDEKLVRANTGVLWFQVEVKGLPVHVRDMSTGTNAIDACWEVITGLRKLEQEWNSKKVGRLHFESEPHPLNLNVAKINAGDWASSVPAWCRVDCRIATFPGFSAKSAAEEIEARVKEVAQKNSFLRQNPPTVTWNGFFSEGYILEPNSEAEQTLQRAHQQATGGELKSFTTAAYLDTRVHSLYDKIPALCYGPVSGNIHGFDEWVSISSLKRITTAIALYVAEWCGVESVE